MLTALAKILERERNNWSSSFYEHLPDYQPGVAERNDEAG